MTDLPKEKARYKDLYDLVNGTLKYRIMISALELGVFDHSQGPVSAQILADELGLHPINANRFLDALATIDLVEKKQGLYWNSMLAQIFLTKDSPTYIGDLLLLTHLSSIAGLDRMTELIRRGPDSSGTEEVMKSPDLWAEWSKAGAQWVFGEMGQTMAEIVSGLPGFAGFEKMLDLGGGHGVFAMYIIDAHPSMQGVVFDRPEVLQVAENFSRKFRLEDRIRTLPGDYMQDEIGEGYDLIFASATLNFAKGRLEDLFAKVYQALKPGGYFISFQDGMTDERTKPDTMLGHLFHSLEIDHDYMFDQGFLAEAMLGAGFRHVRSRTMETPMGLLDLDIGQK